MSCRFVLLLAIAGCVQPNLVPCGELACPADKACATLTEPDQHVCVSQAQLDVCVDLDAHAACHTDAITRGRCYDGVCLAVECGNGRVDIADPKNPSDVGEICDDGNTLAGDGCSADCASTEACGNKLIDFVTGELCDDGNHVDHDGCNSTCSPETPTWTALGFGDAPNRQQHAMAYDATRHELVVFGGLAIPTGEVLGDTMIWDGVGWRRVSSPQMPRARKRHQMAYDPRRHRVVLFGGISADNDTLGDTWEWDGARWIPIFTSSPPAPRSDQGMTYDGARHQVVMFGGAHTRGLGGMIGTIPDLADTWAWDGTTWTQIITDHRPTSSSMAAADGRSNVAMAFDPSRGVTVLFGGTSTYQLGPFTTVNQSNDHVWELDATDWQEIIPTPGPVPRSAAAMAYDPITRRVMLAGGANNSTTFGDVWEWSNPTWTPITGGTLPAGRTFGAAAADLHRNVVVLFGGLLSSGTDAPLWEYSSTGWSAPTTSAPAQVGVPLLPPHVVVDTRRNRPVAVEIGGATYERPGTGGWARVGAIPPSNNGLALAYDPVHAATVLFRRSNTNLAETWLWDGGSWTQAMPATSPPPRDIAAMAADANGKIVLFGGTVLANTALDDTWTWDGTTWTQQTPVHHPPARKAHAMVYDPLRRITLLFGGGDPTYQQLGDTWVWDGSDWTQITTPLAPSARYGEAMAWQPARGRIALVGGLGPGLAPTIDVWEWTGSAWELVGVPPTPRGRLSAMLFPDHDGGGLVLFDGYSANTPITDAWLMRWQSDRTSDTCGPSLDLDGDGLLGCADPDCWYTCTPACPPSSSCPETAPHCGDGACDPDVESCDACPADCGACAAVCGDGTCTPGETGCPGDCP